MIPPLDPRANATTEIEEELLKLWRMNLPSITLPSQFDPIPLSAVVRKRLQQIWMQVKMPHQQLIDMTLKYTHADHVAKINDAIVLWETGAQRILAFEEIVRETHNRLRTVPTMSTKMKHQLLQPFVHALALVKQIILLLHAEVQDFLTFEGQFYLITLHDYARQLLTQLGA